jgi:hypothetical protein
MAEYRLRENSLIITWDSRVGPRYVPVLSGFFSEGMVFSDVSASLSLLKSLQQPSLSSLCDSWTFGNSNFEIATYDSEASPETATL